MKRAVIALVVTGLSITAWAGQKWPVFATGNVTINSVNAQAYGPMGSARNSSNPNERIECDAFASSDGSQIGSCMFQNENGFAFCFSDVPSIVSVISAINADDYLTIAWDKTSHCTWIQADHDSAMTPKAL